MARNLWLAVLTVAAVGVTSAQTMAAEGEAHASPSLFTGDVGNIIWSLVTFIAVLIVLGKFAWKPILGGLQKREEFIRDSLAQAKKDRDEAEARLKEYAAKIEAARTEASAIVQEGRKDAEVLKQRIEEKAREEADAMIARGKREIGIATDTAVKDLYTLTANLATDVASRIIKKELSAADHERLVAEAIEELVEAVARRDAKVAGRG